MQAHGASVSSLYIEVSEINKCLSSTLPIPFTVESLYQASKCEDTAANPSRQEGTKNLDHASTCSIVAASGLTDESLEQNYKSPRVNLRSSEMRSC